MELKIERKQEKISRRRYLRDTEKVDLGPGGVVEL